MYPKKSTALLFALLSLSLRGEAISPEMLKMDPALPSYKATTPMTGKITIIARDRLDKVAASWAAIFKANNPNVECVVQSDGQGNTVADPTWTDKVPYSLLLVRGESRIVFQKRQAQPAEVDEFSKLTGHFPFELTVANFACNASGIHTYGILVHKNNPLEKITLAQADAIFSKERRRGYPNAITTWKQLGVTDKALAEKPIHVYGRDPGSAAQDFRDIVLLGGQFTDNFYAVADLEVAAGTVVSDPKGIAYSDGSNNDRTDLKRLAIAEDENSPYYKGTWADINDRKYPIFRHIFSYSDAGTSGTSDPLTHEFMRMVLSTEGQAALWKEGILPFNAKEASAALAKVK